MKIRITRQTILFGILTLAALLRLWNLGTVPPSASLDEASIGYNAYSIVKTGTDEYGVFPIISHRAYDDWRRAIYLYLVVPFVGLFGLNTLSVRLPAALLSILTVWATYRIILLFFSIRLPWSSTVALMGTFLVAISPWHIYISRLGHESNAYLSFFVFGVLFFLKGIKDKKSIVLAAVFFTFSMVSYYAGQVLVPLFVPGLIFLYRKSLISIASHKRILIALCVFVVFLIPIFGNIFSPEALVRFQGTSTFKPEAHSKEFAELVERRNKAVENHDIVGMVLYNRRLFPIKVFLEGYIAHFNVKWLFTNSSHESFKVPNLGLLYAWEIPFILLGMFGFLSSAAIDARIKKLMVLWFFLAPLPAAIATQAPHAMRSYAFLFPWQIFTAFGLIYGFNALEKIKKARVPAFALLGLLSLAVFYKNYYLVFPKEQSRSFQYALAQSVQYVSQEQDKYDRVIFSNKDNLYQSYMLFLFHSHYDPRHYLRGGGTRSGGFAETHTFEKYEFRPIDWNKDSLLKNTLFVGNPNDFPPGTPTLEQFRYLDEKIGVVAVKT